MPPSPDDIWALLDQGRAGASSERIHPKESLDSLAARDWSQDIRLKKRYADGLLLLLSVQVAVTNGVFIAYAWAGQHWRVPDAVMSAWLGATVVELVGIATVVTRYLFPRRDSN